MELHTNSYKLLSKKIGTITHDADILTALAEDIKKLTIFLQANTGFIDNTPALQNADPVKNGISGVNIAVDANALSGRYYGANGPITIKEAFDSMSALLNNGSVTSEIVDIKDKIGMQFFYGTTYESVYDALVSIRCDIRQLACDVFNENRGMYSSLSGPYALGSGGNQTISRSIVDRVKTLESNHENYGHSNLYIKHTLGSTYDNATQTAGHVKYAAPYLSKITDAINQYEVALDKPGYISKFRLSVGSNSLNSTTRIRIYKNNTYIAAVLVAAGIENQVISHLLDVEIADFDSIHYEIDTSESTAGSISIANITLIIKEKIEG